MPNFPKALDLFRQHYENRLGFITVLSERSDEIEDYRYLSNEKLKPGNGPRILYQGFPTEHVIVLTHGLSDSPHYVSAIAKRFFREGCNVVMPLLPGHGLKKPDKALEDNKLDKKWRATIDNAVQTAEGLGKTISVGGFSTGGALSLNKVLRERGRIKGGLFLFSGALNLGTLAHTTSRLGFMQRISILTDGEIVGIGKDPFKYPMFPNFGGFELMEIIRENNDFLEEAKLNMPAFAAHSAHDETAKLEGIIDFMENHTQNGVALVISKGVAHSSLPLLRDIELDLDQEHGPDTPPKANPKFEWMMYCAMQFFNKEIAGK